MLRRVLITILIFPLLGSQVPAMPHSHAGTAMAEPEDHAARPHVHLHLHGHNHHHSGGQGHQHHAPHVQPKMVKSSSNVATVAIGLAGDHDDDAVYLPEDSTYSPTGKSVSWQSFSQITGMLNLDISVSESTTAQSEGMFSRPPPGSTWSSPLYLRTLSLRI